MVFGSCEDHRLKIVRGKLPCPGYAVQNLQALEQIGSKYHDKPESPKGQQAEFQEKETRCHEHASITSRGQPLGRRIMSHRVASTAKAFIEFESSLCCMLSPVLRLGLCGSGHLQADRDASAAFFRTGTAQHMVGSMLLARLCAGGADLGTEPADMIGQR
jgi:hypothetical protein